jgi:SpoVK/Ycf46/Vps4 family AAA+-type ATPase
MPEMTTLLAGTGIAGIFVACWDKIKLYASKIASIFFVKVEIYGYNSVFAMKVLINEEFNISPLRKLTFRGVNEYVRPAKRNQLVCFERLPSEPTVFWRDKKPLVVSAGGEGVSVSFVRGMYKADELMKEAMDKFNQGKEEKDWKSVDKFFVRKMTGTIGQKSKDSSNDDEETSVDEIAESSSVLKYTGRAISWGRDDLGQPKSASALSTLSLAQNAKDAIREAYIWRDSEDWYKGRRIPWKKGWLLYGKPGTGKTAFVRALAQELNLPIFSFDLATMNNVDFNDSWEKAMDQNPCIALFEDFDSIFKQRKNISVTGMENGLTFDCFLNALDGVQNTDGIFIVITTNDIDSIDNALGNVEQEDGISSRPGRIDRSIEFKNIDLKGRWKMARRIFEGFPEEKWGAIVQKGEKDTGAQFQERCSRLALDLFWTEKNKDIEDMQKNADLDLSERSIRKDLREDGYRTGGDNKMYDNVNEILEDPDYWNIDKLPEGF